MNLQASRRLRLIQNSKQLIQQNLLALREHALLVLALALTLVLLVLAGTEIELSQFLWMFSFFLQSLWGCCVVKFLTSPIQLSKSLECLTGLLFGIFSYSLAYQLLLPVVDDPLGTWLLVNSSIVGTALLIRKRIAAIGIGDTNHSQRASNDLGLLLVTTLGGGLLLVGLAEMRSLLWMGVGLLVVVARHSMEDPEGKKRRSESPLILGVTSLISALLVWGLDRPFGKFWFVTSNDFQTSIALAVSESRFGFFDQGRFFGHRDTYHWAVYGWAGMTAPFGDYVVQVVVLTPILICGLLFLASLTWIDGFVYLNNRNSSPRLVIIWTAISAIFISAGLSSYTTQFGILNVICFALLLQGAHRSYRGVRYYFLVGISLFSVVWSNALSIVFVVAVLAANLIQQSIAEQSRTFRNLRRHGIESALLIVFAIGCWCLLYLPAARGGSFQVAPLGQRDNLFPNLAQVLNFMDPRIRSVLFEIATSQSLFFALLLMLGICCSNLAGLNATLQQVPVVIGATSLVSLLLLRGYEMNKFYSWGSIGTFMIFGALANISFGKEWVQRCRRPDAMMLLSMATAVVIFGVGLADQLLPYFGKYSLFGKYSALESLSLVPVVAITLGFIYRWVLTRKPFSILISSMWTFLAVFSFQSGVFSGQYLMELRQRQQLVDVQNDVYSRILITDTEVEEVADFIRGRTPEKSVIASNYFCSDGRRCPSRRLLQVPQSELRPNIWGLNADMSDLTFLSQRRFLIQAPRHVFGNDTMPTEAQKRFRLSAEFALSRIGNDELREYGVDYFVLDWSAVDGTARTQLPNSVFENSRFSVISIES